VTANFSPVFPLTPNVGLGKAVVANTSRDGTGTLVDVLTTGANGTIINRIQAWAQVTTVASTIRLFLFDGATNWLYEEIAVAAVTPSGTVSAWSGASARVTPATPLTLPTGWKIRACTNDAQAVNVIAEGGDL
jgi:hypothetical protein